MTELSRSQMTESLRGFTSRRDALLHEDEAAFEHLLSRFLGYCDTDKLVQSILASLPAIQETDVDNWWGSLGERNELEFPSAPDSELSLRYAILKSLAAQPTAIFKFGHALGHSKRDEALGLFRVLVVRPLAEELSHRLGEAANITTPEARALQAVPLARIPSESEVRIFLSHKTVDKPMVVRYHIALKELGYDPWLDQPAMPAGVNLERSMFEGFEQSCAAVFFVTGNFTDEKYIAAEIEYAVMQKRKKDRKFAIITLRYPGSPSVPGLLTPYVYKDVENDLDGFNEVIRALPIELGPVRWKRNVVIE